MRAAATRRNMFHNSKLLNPQALDGSNDLQTGANAAHASDRPIGVDGISHRVYLMPQGAALCGNRHWQRKNV